MKYCCIDFEYNDTAEEILNLVCVSFTTYPEKVKSTIWLHKDADAKRKLKEKIQSLSRSYTFISYNISAEASAFISLQLGPENYKLICLYTEFRMLGNHNHKISCGKHYIEGKEEIIIPPKPKWMREEGEAGNKKLTFSLSQACYKFLGVKIDSERKEAMRDLIISSPDEFTEEEKSEIMEYCDSDVEYLMPLYEKMLETYQKLLPKSERHKLHDEMLLRGENMARAARIERDGYPIDVDATKNFANSVSQILMDIQRDINEQFPELWPFEYNKKNHTYTMKAHKLKQWIIDQDLSDNWMRTDTGDLSLALEAWERVFDFKHDYPRGNLGAQIVRLLKTKQSLNGFMPPKKGKKSFWDYLGKDGRVRPYLNPYGSQASRYQPSATSFLFLKSAWMRSLGIPPAGKMIVGCDFKSEEFLIKAITFLDKAMMNAYKTGDPYLAFAKDIKLVPVYATKKSHPTERQQSKSSILGIQYDMTKWGLAKKLTLDTGIPHSEDEAQFWINSFNEAYVDQYLGAKSFIECYRNNDYAKLMDGWYMFGDNANDRSVGNFPHQGHGAVILRLAIKYCQEKNLKVIIPLHDALYIECASRDFKSVDIFADCMKRAFKDSFPLKYQKYAEVFLDLEAWFPDLVEEEEYLTKGGNKIKLERIHRDPRALSEYEKFKKYFTKPDHTLL